MCGFVGSYGDEACNIEMLKKMTSSLNHRGPDSNALWTESLSSFGFGHTRLAIQDISENGAQPMHSSTGRYVVVFNGCLLYTSDAADE